MMRRARVVVLGGGFAGVYTALSLELLVARGAPVDVSLVNRKNYLVFQPMLPEIVAGDVGILDTVSPLRQLLQRSQLFVREIEGVDLDRRVVTIAAGLTPGRRRATSSRTIQTGSRFTAAQTGAAPPGSLGRRLQADSMHLAEMTDPPVRDP